MDIEQAVKLANTLKKNNLHAVVTGDRIEFEGGAFGGHGLWLDVSSPERILAHWNGYCSAQPAPAAALIRYLVVVEGSFSYKDGRGSMRTCCVGWVEVKAPSGASLRTISGLARNNQERVQWEVEEKVTYGRTLEFEIV